MQYKIEKRETKKHKREKIRALSEGGEQPVNPPSGTRKKIINNEAYVVSDHRIPTLEWQLKA